MNRQRFGEMTMDEKPVVMVDWPGESAVGEIMDALKRVDDGFSTGIRSWGQFKKAMPTFHWFNNTHILHHDYCTEITKCGWRQQLQGLQAFW